MAKIKLSEYARRMGISHRTAWRWYRDGKITGEVVGPRNIFIDVDDPKAPSETAEMSTTQPVYIYCRVSTSRDKANLDRQVERVKDYCRGKGYQIAKVDAEIGSGLNDHRAKLMGLLKNEAAKIIVVEHKDRLTRFGFNYIAEMLKMAGRRVEVVDLTDHPEDDLMHDLVSVITSFCARLYGQRRGGTISKKTIAFLNQQAGE